MNAPYRQLTQSQRYQIEAGLASGMALSGIAQQIGVHTTTVSREVRRNSSGDLYKAVQAGDKSMTEAPVHASTVSLERC